MTSNSDQPPRVYCSGPLFSPEEVSAMKVIAETCESAGMTTFLPHRDGIEAIVMPLSNTALDTNLFGARDAIDRGIFALDVFQIVEMSDVVVVNLNGRVPDEGAVVEAAIAFAVGVPVLLYKRDARSVFNGRDNAMVLGLAADSVSEVGQIPGAIRRVVPGANPSRDYPAALAAALQHGRLVWSVLQRANRLRRQGEPDSEWVRSIREVMSVEAGV